MAIRTPAPKTVAELRAAIPRKSGSWGAATSIERRVVMLFFAERLVNIEKALVALAQKPEPNGRKKNGYKKRPKTEWQKFFAAGMKAGKAPALIGQEWREKKGS